MNTGIYFITAPNGKRYIGSAAVSFRVRWNSHRHHLKRGTHCNPHLQRAWAKYGEENMVFSVYLRCEPHECLELEQIAIDVMCPEYNVARNVTKSFLGLRHKPESLKKISASKKGQGLGRRMPELQRKLLRAINTGRIHTPEQRAAISAMLTGRTYSEELILKMSEAAKNRSPEWGKKLSARRTGADNPMYGRTGDKHPRFGTKSTPETCARISAVAKLRTGENSQRGRAVLCVELDRVFPTARLAMDWLREQDLTTARDGHIHDVCRGQRPIAHGYHWRYADQPTVDNPPVAP